MRVVKNYLYNVSYQIFILIIPLITTPYLARVLGPKGVGINSYTNSIVQYFILFGSIGVNLYGNRQIAFVRDDKEKLTNTFYDIFVMRALTVVIASLAFIIFINFSKEYRVYYWAQFISLVAAAFDISWFFMGIENFAVTVLRNFIVKILTLVSIFVFVKTSNDLFGYILILSLSLLFGNLVLFPNLSKYINKFDFHKLHVFIHFWPSFLLFIPQIATQIYVVLNKTMLGSMASVQSAGYFDQSDKIVKIILAVVTATGTVMLPHVSSAFNKGKYSTIKKLLYESFSFVTSISVPLSFGLIAVSKKFVPLFFTDKFNSVIPIMMIESIVILLIAWSNAIGVQYLLPTKQNSSYTVSVIVGAIINLIANIPLILIFGAIGAAIATVLSEGAVTSYQLFIIRKQVCYKKIFSDFGKYILSGLIMFVIVKILDEILSISWLSLLIEVLTGAFIYFIMLVLLKAKILLKVKSFLN